MTGWPLPSPTLASVPTVAIIPVKSFVLGKQRLSSALDPTTRAGLGRRLAEHVATTAASADLVPLIVTADAEVAEWSTLTGFPSVPDPGDGLDQAAHAGVAWARTSKSTWMVLHSDLPLVTPSDLTALKVVLEEGHGVISPSADGGTSAIGSIDVVDFSYGVASFHRHLARLGDPAIVTRPGLLLDVDSPADLDAAASNPRGRWITDLILGSNPTPAGQNLY